LTNPTKRSFTPLPYFDAQPLPSNSSYHVSLSHAVSASASFTEYKDFSSNIMDSMDDMSCASDVSWKQLNQVASIEEDVSQRKTENVEFEKVSVTSATVLDSRKDDHEDRRMQKRRSAPDEREPPSTKRSCISQNEDRELYCSLSMESLDDTLNDLSSRSFSLKLKEDDVQDFIVNGLGDRLPSWDIQGQGSFEGDFSVTFKSGERPDSALGTALTFGDEDETNLFNFDEVSKSPTPSCSVSMTKSSPENHGMYPHCTYGDITSPNGAYSRQVSSSTQKTSNTSTTPIGVGYHFNGFMPMAFVPPHPSMMRTAPHSVFLHASHPMQCSPHTKLSLNGTEVCTWSKTDDEKLSNILKKHKTKDWEVIASEFGQGKTSKECQERWIRYLKPGVRKGQWTDQEDRIVMETVKNSKEQPFTRWSDLAQKLPGRVGKQIRDRWVNHLNPHINHLPFTREDDMLLYNGHKEHGKKWVEISTTFFNSTRSENQVKNRWYSASFKKFCDAEFGAGTYASFDKKTPKKSAKGGEK
jgi:hypothetical protein